MARKKKGKGKGKFEMVMVESKNGDLESGSGKKAGMSKDDMKKKRSKKFGKMKPMGMVASKGW